MKNSATADTILSIVTEVRLEIESKGKSISTSEDTLCKMVMDKVAEDGKDFDTDKGWMRYYANVTRDIAWHLANTEEADKIAKFGA